MYRWVKFEDGVIVGGFGCAGADVKSWSYVFDLTSFTAIPDYYSGPTFIDEDRGGGDCRWPAASPYLLDPPTWTPLPVSEEHRNARIEASDYDPPDYAEAICGPNRSLPMYRPR